ncbi:helix-turn-helix domain-containing protein [Priestia aryabhattai]|uniref:helix-turn-helix domain-containing protein n=1 Tax=Priestia aryabhattai TaxID=412384 RepID=UPI0015F513CA|nr:helix-turn-helix domain-containing protein [Priestia aryabhattai]
MNNTKNNIPKETLEKGKAFIRKQLKDEGLTTQAPAFTIQSVEHYDAVTDTFYTKAHIVEDMDFIRDGGLAKLNATAYKVLKIIVAHVDKDGFSFISQEKIAKMLSLSERQVGSIIRTHLLEGTDKKTGQPLDVRYGGKLLLKAVKLPAPNGHQFTLYHPINCTLDHTPYNFADELEFIPESDQEEADDIPVLDIADVAETEQPEAFIIPESKPEELLEVSETALRAITKPVTVEENKDTTKPVKELKKADNNPQKRLLEWMNRPAEEYMNQR